MLRVAIPMRVREGTSGTVTAYVVPKNAPKTCSRVVCPLHTLCLHHRVRAADDSAPCSTLQISGDFSAADARQWLRSCLPDMPKVTPGAAPPLVYESASFGTQVMVAHSEGRIMASSDNLCALAALRDSITRCAGLHLLSCLIDTRLLRTARWPYRLGRRHEGWLRSRRTDACRDATQAGARIKITNSPRKETVAHFLRKLWPKLVAERDRAVSVQLLDALEDVTNQVRQSSLPSRAPAERPSQASHYARAPMLRQRGVHARMSLCKIKCKSAGKVLTPRRSPQEGSKAFLTEKMRALMADGAKIQGESSGAASEVLLEFYLDEARVMYREWRMHQGEFDAERSMANLLHLLKSSDSTLNEVEEFVLRD